MIVQPTDGSLSEFNSKKLQPCLEETKATAQRVAKQTSRSASGSTTYEKRFGRYTLTLALASSSADLRSKTIQKAFLDECDEYPGGPRRAGLAVRHDRGAAGIVPARRDVEARAGQHADDQGRVGDRGGLGGVGQEALACPLRPLRA